jgi:3'-phosphoadenosine 5'-phosphosulfate sulfotransferase (PAPS reductase)/FAD synthetase
MTRLVSEWHAKGHASPCRVLECLGFRADESSARAKRKPFSRNARATNGKRMVDTWLPIHQWSLAQVWASIKASGVPYHFAYDLGMPRLSCCFCIFAPKAALVLAARHNPELLEDYIGVERRTGHQFKKDLSLIEIQTAARNDSEPVGPISSWFM